MPVNHDFRNSAFRNLVSPSHTKKNNACQISYRVSENSHRIYCEKLKHHVSKNELQGEENGKQRNMKFLADIVVVA